MRRGIRRPSNRSKLNQMPTIRDLERDLYPCVERWLKRDYPWTRPNVGTTYGLIDVLGVRRVGGLFSGEYELSSVEVKLNRRQFARKCGQALGYRVYAN